MATFLVPLFSVLKYIKVKRNYVLYTFSSIIELLEIQLLIFGLNVFIYVFVCVSSKGIKVEGILRQSADVEEVKRRVREYEQGKFAFVGYIFYLF